MFFYGEYVSLMNWLRKLLGYNGMVWFEDFLTMFSGFFIGVILMTFFISYIVKRSVRDPDLKYVILTKAPDDVTGEIMFYSNPHTVSEILDVFIATLRAMMSPNRKMTIRSIRRERRIFCTFIIFAAIMALFGIWMIINVVQPD